MSGQALAITGSGMVCGVGLSAPASCAAIRCAISNFQETRFMDSSGEWIMGSSVPMEKSLRGSDKLIKMLASVVRECSASDPNVNIQSVPVLICIAEKDRPGRLQNLDSLILADLQRELGLNFHSKSGIIADGRFGLAAALREARKLIYDAHFNHVIIAGSDSLLVGSSLQSYEERERLLTKDNTNGFIPGEAAAAVLVQKPLYDSEPQLVCKGIGETMESATVDAEDVPLRADGMVQAIRSALAEAQMSFDDLDFRIADVSGEQYGFKEAALALTRILRQRKSMFDFWHPADCIGEVGAAVGPSVLTVLLAGMQKGYCPGTKTIAHLSNDDGSRAAMVMTYQPAGEA